MTTRRLKNSALGELCNQVEYHIVDQIQPHGILFVVDAADLTIRFCSETAAQLVAGDARALIGQSFYSLCQPDGECRLRAALSDKDASIGRWEVEVDLRAPRRAKQTLILSRSDEHLCIEIDLTDDSEFVADYSLSRYTECVSAISTHDGDENSLAEMLCHYLLEILRVDRVYYLVFSGEGDGFVPCEKSNGVFSSLIGHHFPSTDIPRNMRQMYIHNTFRYFRSTEAKQADLLGPTPASGVRLDLRYSFFRPPGATHIQYLRNMGVTSSLSFSVVRDGALAGMFGGHSAREKSISYRQMLTARALVGAFTDRLQIIEAAAGRRAYAARFNFLQRLVDAFEALDHDFSAFVAQYSEDLRALVEADHFIARFDGKLHVPPELSVALGEALIRVAELRLSAETPLYCTDCVSLEEGSLFLARQEVSGILALALDKQAKNIVIWGRVGQLRVEKWAGDPAQAVQMDSSAQVGPRKSFETWVKHVENRSLGWQAHSLGIATRFREMFGQSLIQYFSSKDLAVWKSIATELEIAKSAAEKASRQKTLFLSNVSHELRTPLHTIIGFSEVLREKGDRLGAEKTQRYLNLIGDGANRLLLMINDLLDLSTKDAGKVSYHFGRHDLAALVADIVAELHLAFAEKALSVAVEGHLTEPVIVFDRPRLGQVLINILNNAVKFSPREGKITVSLIDHCRHLGRSGVSIAVADQGPGIPEEELTSIFTAFTQSSRTRNQAGGWGLGLAICRDIVEAHQGAIWADNAAGGGATFFVEIPRSLPLTQD